MKDFLRAYFQDKFNRLLWALFGLFALLGLYHVLGGEPYGWLGVGMGIAPVLHLWLNFKR